MFKGRLTFKILMFLGLTDILETLTQVCFKKSVLFETGHSISSMVGAIPILQGAACSPFLWLGFLSVGLTFIIWSSVLSRIDLSVAVPVASFSYILVPVISIIFLHEKVTLLRWAGILSIIIGVIIVSFSTRERSKNAI